MAMKARKRSELHISEVWLDVRLVYNCLLNPVVFDVEDRDYDEGEVHGIGCLVDCMVACHPGRRSGWTPTFPSLASCVISVVVSPAIPKEAGHSAD